MERGNRLHMCTVRLTDQEMARVQERMNSVGIISKSAFLRKMAMDGYIAVLNIPELKEMISLLRYSSNNLNQIAKKVNAMGMVFEDDLKEIKSMQSEIWKSMNKILKRLGQVQ